MNQNEETIEIEITAECNICNGTGGYCDYQCVQKGEYCNHKIRTSCGCCGEKQYTVKVPKSVIQKYIDEQVPVWTEGKSVWD
jgi:hypothetical protein